MIIHLNTPQYPQHPQDLYASWRIRWVIRSSSSVPRHSLKNSSPCFSEQSLLCRSGWWLGARSTSNAVGFPPWKRGKTQRCEIWVGHDMQEIEILSATELLFFRLALKAEVASPDKWFFFYRLLKLPSLVLVVLWQCVNEDPFVPSIDPWRNIFGQFWSIVV